MKNEIVIHAKGNETRIALIENGELSQFFVESPEVIRTVGDIYVAEVKKVMAGIRAGFIYMGTPKDAFLHFSDVGEHLTDIISKLNGEDALKHVNPEIINIIKTGKDKNGNEVSGHEKQSKAGDILRTGQKLLVQIVKEPMGSKGPRVSTDITLAGRFVVLIPFGDYIAVSKRIRSFRERKRLRATVSDMLPEGFGVIVRTVAGGQSDEMIQQDLQEQLNKWKHIVEKSQTAKPPALLHRDLDMTESLIRDFFAKDFDRVLIDDPKLFKQIKSYVTRVAPRLAPNIQPYKGKEHIFDNAKIGQDVDSIFSPRVKMPSGGYLIFEQTEAMYVVDVNSGRYAAKRNQEENSLKTNLESAREIAKQLRLRDIGGIIVVDFIDLKSDVNRKKIYDELKKEFRKDRAKTNILPMSDFGLIQITRQRIKPSVINSVSKVCPMCGGSGTVISQNTILTDLEAWLTKFKHLYRYRSLDLYVNPYLRSVLTRGFFNHKLRWFLKYRIRIGIFTDENISMNDFKFALVGSDADITEAVLTDQPIEIAIKQAEDEMSNQSSTSKKDPSNLDVVHRSDAQRHRDNTKVEDSEWEEVEQELEKTKSTDRNDGNRSNTSQRRSNQRRPSSRKPNPQKNQHNEADENEAGGSQGSQRNSSVGNQKTTARRNVSSKYYKSDDSSAEKHKDEQPSNNE